MAVCVQTHTILPSLLPFLSDLFFDHAFSICRFLFLFFSSDLSPSSFPLLVPHCLSLTSFSFLLTFTPLYGLFCFVFFSTIFISFLFRIHFPSSLFLFIYLFIYSVTSALLHHSHLVLPDLSHKCFRLQFSPFFLLQSVALPSLPDIKLEI